VKKDSSSKKAFNKKVKKETKSYSKLAAEEDSVKA
jgi:hypothetical protein